MIRNFAATLIATLLLAASQAQAQVPYCGNMSLKSTAVGTTAVPVPTTMLRGRSTVVVCNPLENVGSPVLKCRADGVVPVLGPSTPGDLLSKGECIPYAIPGGAVVRCISDAAGTYAKTTECNGVPTVPAMPFRDSGAAGERIVFADLDLQPTEALTATATVGGFSACEVTIKNGNTSQTRQPTITFLATDPTALGTTSEVTLDAFLATTIEANSTGRVLIGEKVSGTTVLTANTLSQNDAFARVLPQKIQVTVPAPGSGTGSGYAFIKCH